MNTILVFYEEHPLSEAECAHWKAFKQEALVEVVEIVRDTKALAELVSSRVNANSKQTVVVSVDQDVLSSLDPEKCTRVWLNFKCSSPLKFKADQIILSMTQIRCLFLGLDNAI
jgi:hypothetical protein